MTDHIIIQTEVAQDGLVFYVSAVLGPANHATTRDHIRTIRVERLGEGPEKAYRCEGQFGGRAGFVTIIPREKREPFVHYVAAFAAWAQIEAQLPLESFLIQ
jgi:hypothetical protein